MTSRSPSPAQGGLHRTRTVIQPKQIPAHDPDPLPKTNQDRIVTRQKLMSSDPSFAGGRRAAQRTAARLGTSFRRDDGCPRPSRESIHYRVQVTYDRNILWQKLDRSVTDSKRPAHIETFR